MSNWQFTEQHYNLLRDDIIEIKATVKQQNGRVRKLELWRAGLIGAWGIIALGLTIIAKQLGLW